MIAMRRNLALFMAIVLASFPFSVRAAPQSSPPIVMVLTAGVSAAVPMLVGTCFYSITNNDPNPVFWGLRSSVTGNNGGTPIPSGSSTSITVQYQSAQAGSVIWLYSTTGNAGTATSDGGVPALVTVNEGC